MNLLLFLIISAAAFAILIACIDDPDEQYELPNIPLPRWKWWRERLPAYAMGFVAVAFLLLWIYQALFES